MFHRIALLQRQEVHATALRQRQCEHRRRRPTRLPWNPNASCSCEDRPVQQGPPFFRQRAVLPQEGARGRLQRPTACCAAPATSPDGEPLPERAAPASTSGRGEERGTPFLRVPWGTPVIVKVLVLWALAFWILGYWLVPIGLDLAGLEREELSARGQALVHALQDLGQLSVTLAVLWRALHRFRPRALGWFRTSLWPLGWLVKVVGACVIIFPLAETLAHHSQHWFPSEVELWNAELMEHSLMAGDLLTRGLYFIIVAVCAPVWEEVIFRGFLLPSLAKYMPMAASILVSSVLFAVAHCSTQRFLPLCLLGVVFGTLYAESHNLLAAMTAHSLWNCFVFLSFLVDPSPPLFPV